MNLLDLDDALTWEETYKAFLIDDPSWGIIDNALSSDADDAMYVVFQELTVRDECVQSPDLLSLRHRCTDHFRSVFTHVAAYHACRPTDINSYLNAGILPSDTVALANKAVIFFDDPDGVNKALKDIGAAYLEHGSGKIGFFISRTGALEPGYTHYLRYGSELAKCVASRLDDLALQRVSGQGIPTLFRCALPLSWLDAFTTVPMTAPYAIEPLVQLIVRLRKRDHSGGTIRGAFLLTHPVPREQILESIDMTPFMKEEYEI